MYFFRILWMVDLGWAWLVGFSAGLTDVTVVTNGPLPLVRGDRSHLVTHPLSSSRLTWIHPLAVWAPRKVLAHKFFPASHWLTFVMPFQSKSSVVVQSKGESFQGHQGKEEKRLWPSLQSTTWLPFKYRGWIGGPANCYLDQENLEHISWIF